MPTTAPTAPQPVDFVGIFQSSWERTSAVGRALDGFPAQFPVAVLSTYTALPLFSVVAAAACPNPTFLARALAASLGCLLGTGVGTFLKRAKKEAARCAVLRLLISHIQASTTVEELRALVQAARKRFSVPAGKPAGDVFEDGALCEMYEGLLSATLNGPEHDPLDLPTLRRLKAALDLDGIVVGFAHKRAAQLLVSRGYSGLEGEAMRRATNKLLFLSDRAFADEEPEEAAIFEMSRLRDVLKMPDREAKQRIREVSRALYQQSLSKVADKVDADTGEALAGASAAFGLAGDETALMNAETYRQIVSDVLAVGELTPSGSTTLERARSVLQLSSPEAAKAYEAVVAPMLGKDVGRVAGSLKDEAAETSAEKLQEFSSKLAERRDQLGLPKPVATAVLSAGFGDTLRALYNGACKDVRINGEATALAALDKLIAFSLAADKVLTGVASEEAPAPVTLTADQAAGRRLYGIYLSRSFDTEGDTKASPEELARVLELSAADEEAARTEVCQPRLKELLEAAIEASEKEDGVPLSKAKVSCTAVMSKFQLPLDAVHETAIEVYKARLAKVADRILTAEEKEMLDGVRSFLELTEKDVRLFHLKAFAKTYEQSITEAMGRDGIMAAEAREALFQLRERLGISEEDALTILHNVVEARLKNMMENVREAWEEATYTKEALTQIYKERGKDIGDDPSADGSGGELGIKDSPPLEGVRGFQLMQELTKVANFYTGNQVVVESSKGGEPQYPVTIGKYVEEKTKEEMFGIFAWNAITCQDGVAREKWERAKPHVGGILGLGQKEQQKVVQRMVSRWCNMFIKQKLQEQGELSETDISTLTTWVPQFFGIDKDVTKEMVQVANKTLLQGKALRLLNKPTVTPEDVQKLRKEVETWDLLLQKDLELSKPQLRALFRIEVKAALEDPDLNFEQKQDVIDASAESFGLSEREAGEELLDLLKARVRSCLVTAVGDLMQGNEGQAMQEMQRLELLASFASDVKMDLDQSWEVALGMREKLVKKYAASAVGNASPDVELLERTLGLVAAPTK